MFDILGMATALKRPTFMVQTARFGVDDYQRDRHLARILRTPTLPNVGEALIKLLDLEKQLEGCRKDRTAGYSFARHIDVLIAIMAEAKTLRAASAPRLVSTEGQSV